jgi:hypothetical protein
MTMHSGLETKPGVSAGRAVSAAIALTVSSFALYVMVPCALSYVVARAPGWGRWLWPIWAVALFASASSGLVVSIVAMRQASARCSGRRRALVLVCLAGCALCNLLAAAALAVTVSVLAVGHFMVDSPRTMGRP